MREQLEHLHARFLDFKEASVYDMHYERAATWRDAAQHVRELLKQPPGPEELLAHGLAGLISQAVRKEVQTQLSPNS